MIGLAAFLVIWALATKALPFAREASGFTFAFAVLLLARRSLYLGTSLYALSFSFVPLFPGRLLGVPALNVTNLMKLGLAGVAASTLAASKGERAVGRPAITVVLVTYVWLLASVFMAVMGTGIAMGHGLDLWWKYVLATLPLFAAVGVARQGGRGPAFLLGALAVSLVILCIWAYVEYQIDLRGAGRTIRMAGRFGQANNFGGLLAIVLPGFVALAWEGPDRRRRLAGWFGCGIVGICLLSTASRGSLLAGGLAFLALGILRYRGLLVLFVAAAILAGPYLLPDQVKNRFTDALESGEDEGEVDNSTEIRKMMYTFAPVAFQDNPVFGAGLGGFPTIALNHGRPELARSTHSWYLQVFTEMGLVGLALFGLLTATVIRGLRAGPRGQPGTLDGALTPVMLAATVALAILCFFQDPFLDSEFIVPPYFLGLGLALGRSRGKA
ncbi:MAG: O-antigen ligase family protein [Acidobacteriota bacterium]|jgi:hypothetical protein